MQLHFTKMHGLGNDFVVIDGIRQAFTPGEQQVRRIADRHFGIGCDQLLLVQRAESPDADFRYRIFNADGGEVEQCGNGARCFAKFVRDKGLTDKTHIRVETLAGLLTLQVEADGQVTVDMGVPRFAPEDIPLRLAARAADYHLELDGQTVTFGSVSLGNPHAVIRVDAVATAPVADWGPRIETHALFPERVNVGFMEVLSGDHIRLRVFERGAGETLACGSGACAAVVIGRQWGLLGDSVTVELPGGRLQIRWAGEGRPVMMTGPAQSVFEGSLEL